MTPIDRSPSAQSTREQLTHYSRRISRGYVAVFILLIVIFIAACLSVARSISTQQNNESIGSLVAQQQSILKELLDDANALVDFVRRDDTIPGLVRQRQKKMAAMLIKLKENQSIVVVGNGRTAQPWIKTLDVDLFYFRPPHMLEQEIDRIKFWFLDLIAASPETLERKYGQWFPLESVTGDVLTVNRVFKAFNAHISEVREINHRTHQTLLLVVLPCLLLAIALLSFLLFRVLWRRQNQHHDTLAASYDDLGWQVEHDRVTELANVTHAEYVLEELASKVSVEGGRYGIYLLRMHQLNAIYEKLGSEKQAQLLQIVADRLRILFPDAWCLARVSEHDFLVIPDEQTSTDQAQQTAQKIIHAVERTVSLNEQAISPIANIGLSLLPEDGVNVSQIRSNCEIALREAVQRAKSLALPFHQSMRRPLDKASALTEEIRHGLAQGEFSAFFQPKFTLSNGHYCGCEALIRWHHPVEGLLLPGEFLSAAHNAGLMDEITKAMFNNVRRHCEAWHEQGLDPAFVALNIPERTLFSESMVAHVGAMAQALKAMDVGLQLEIAEDVAVMQDRGKLDDIAERVYELDVAYVLDDFGAGIASLTHLHSLPFKVVQLERKLVENINKNDQADNTLASLLSLIHALGKKSAAKGIETQQHFEQLQLLGCHIGQGTLFSQPLPPDGMRQFLANESSTQWPAVVKQVG